ncbi:hypothetical protein EK21DRAFT_57493 [Setomelanomma holmii]|uniref:Ubiquitin-like domain-containing protein n=1 Tax=Setomelanomma holmii TaxID=210430 RepID=A0A9P4HJ27_9PLEO|nr:hypothetical protein EK21DRAFT_57493 [Setomelanomma holmii]
MAEESQTINLKVLSPSTEVEGGVTFAGIPATTTIKELRSRIQDAVLSKPATDRMRLIYRGRVVANDADTLGGVFGADNIRESKEQSLHLVLRELPPNAPPNPFRPAQAAIPASPPLHTNPFRTIPQPRPNSQPQVLPHHHHHHPHVHHHHLPGPPNPFQIALPPAIQQHLAQTMNMAQNRQAHNNQAPNSEGQQGSEETPRPDNGAPVPPMGLPPLPGFGPPNLPPNGRTLRQEGIGPNGERWSVTYSSANIPAGASQPHPPMPFPHPPGFGIPPRPTGSPAPTEAIDRLVPRMRFILQSARQEMENVRTLLQASNQQAPQPAQPIAGTAPLWRMERIRQHIQIMGQNLNLVERGLGVIAADASMTDNPDVVALRQSATELRGHLEELNRTIGQQGGTTTIQPAPADSLFSSLPSSAAPTSTTPSASSQPETQAHAPTLPSEAPQELFLLSSPQGPVGLLFDQRGTYMTAPMVPTLPFQTFTNQFAQNRQLIAGLGQQIAQGSQHSHLQLANIQPTPTPTQAAAGNVQGENQAQPPGQEAGQGQAQNVNQAQLLNDQPMVPGGNDGIANIGGHLWLIFKLACFVYFFSGTGWYKSILLGVIAGAVYLAQIGVFEEQFNLVRRHFEALMPVGALAERAAQPRNAAQRQQRVEPGRNLTPEEAARRLLQQHQNGRVGWVRESMRTVERSFAIFVASLWPGIGERMVHAQEERLRTERAAEEERQQQEEEKAKAEAEAQQQREEQKNKPHGEVEGESSSSNEKGKEKAATAEDDAYGSSSGAAA